MLKELLRLLVCCLIIVIVMLASRGLMAHMNDKTDILSIECTSEATKREKQN